MSKKCYRFFGGLLTVQKNWLNKMAEKGSEPMPAPTVHLLITLRGPVWRVRILIHGVSRLCWRSYRVAEYPTPEAVARRCAAGLAKCKPKNDTDNCKIVTIGSGQFMGVLLFGFGGSVGERFDNSALR